MQRAGVRSWTFSCPEQALALLSLIPQRHPLQTQPTGLPDRTRMPKAPVTPDPLQLFSMPKPGPGSGPHDLESQTALHLVFSSPSPCSESISM